jgi:hypothetical protein
MAVLLCFVFGDIGLSPGKQKGAAIPMLWDCGPMAACGSFDQLSYLYIICSI